MKTIEVVAAMIQVEDMILVVQRKEDEKAYKSLKWEFPGGKVEEGERPEGCSCPGGKRRITIGHTIP